jgi:glycerophosphoryl diester phosphodiesterase
MKVVGHRGAPAHAPENTLASFRRAAADGAHGIEFDVHRSCDGVFVVVHDFLVDRTTNGSGLVSDLHSEVLLSLDAGSWFSPAFSGEQVPLLAEVLALPDLELELEAKFFDRSDLEAVVVEVDAAGVFDRVEFTSSNTPMLMALKRTEPAARIGVFSPRREPWMVDAVFESFVVSRAEFAEADVVHVHTDDITPSVVARLRGNGHAVHANDAAGPQGVLRARRCGADRISTDDPAVARVTIDAAETTVDHL